MKRLIPILLVLPLLACSSGRGPTSGPTTNEAGVGARPGQTPGDAKPLARMMANIEVYQISVPVGTISGNDEFWKRMNETCVDVATYDLLFRNGIRVGVAPQAEWNYFQTIMADNPTAVRKTVFLAGKIQDGELEMSPQVETEDIFWYDSSNALTGRTFDRCINLMSISFQPVVRKAGDVRVSLCPTVRSTRKQIRFNRQNEAVEIEFVQPERLYDLNLRVDIPPDSFLLISPSTEGKWPTSLGRTFLIKEGRTEKLEQLLLVVPKPFRLTEIPSEPAGAEK